MQLNNAPPKIPAAFAGSGNKNSIPIWGANIANQYNASYQYGFPPITMQPLPSGGKPPDGLDFNGILYSITVVQNWQSAGGMFIYDPTFANTVGGYPKGALILKTSGTGLLQSTIDNNFNDPTLPNSGWIDPVLSSTINPTNDASFSDSSDSPASTSWVRGAMSSIFSAAGFAASLGANGFFRLPSFLGGFIFQWGNITSGDDTYTPITFPLQFPNVIYTMNATAIYNGGNIGGSTVSAWVGNVSTSGASIGIGVVTPTPGFSAGAYWFALGR